MASVDNLDTSRSIIQLKLKIYIYILVLHDFEIRHRFINTEYYYRTRVLLLELL